MEALQEQMQQWDWDAAFWTWLVVIALVSLGGFVLNGIFAGLSRGSLWRGFAVAADRAVGLFEELISLSPRRVLALTRLNILESLRGKVLLVFVVFALLFLFAPWYLPGRAVEQVKTNVSFLYLTTTLIVTIVAGLLASTSLPKDIRLQTIHTVVTKPARRLEILLGRVLGLTAGATAMLVVMGAVSYIYLTRSVNNSLSKLDEELAAAEAQKNIKHAADVRQARDQIRGQKVARVPVMGKLEFVPAGKFVGQEDTYRAFIEGNRPEAGVWRFSGLPVQRILAKGEMPVELTFWVFRTYKGEIGRGVLAQLTFVNPHTGRQVVDYPFEVREYYVNQQVLDNNPAKSRNYYVQGQPFVGAPPDPLAWLLEGSSGELNIEARCLSSAMYLGMADPDLYILLGDANFGWNFAKGLIDVWLAVFVIICVAVTASTFLSAPVTILTTIAVFVGALCMDFLRTLARGQALGGGPFEAFARIVMHENLQRPMEEGFWTTVIKVLDTGMGLLLRGLTYALPDLGTFSSTPFVANGFNLGGMLLVQDAVVAMAYAIPFILLGYFFFQSREIAR